MILAVDPGLATCGWAVQHPRTGAVLELGTFTSSPNRRVDESTDRARRAAVQASALGAIAAKHSISLIAAEAMSFGGPPKARFKMAISLGLSWGVICGVANTLGVELLEVTPKEWQHAIQPDVDKIDYEVVFRELSKYVKRQAALQLAGIPKGQQNHALDAVAVGLYVVFGPKRTRIAKGRAS